MAQAPHGTSDWLYANYFLLDGQWIPKKGHKDAISPSPSQSLIDAIKTLPGGSQGAKKAPKTKIGDGLNKLERSFQAFLFKNPDRIQDIKVQDIILRLGNDCRYVPDFSCWMNLGNGPEYCFWEVKGFMREDALVKLKVAARLYAPWKFFLVTKPKGSVDFHIEQVKT